MDNKLFVVGFIGGLLIVAGIAGHSVEIIVFMTGFLIAFVVISWLLGGEYAGDNTSDNRRGERNDFGGESLG